MTTQPERVNIDLLHAVQQHRASLLRASCTWSEQEDGQWETGCARLFEFTDGTPHANKFAYCPYCGSRLIEQRLAHTNTPPGADEDE